MDVDISVVIPVYNGHASIREVVKRTLALEPNPSLEVILVEDASQDDSRKILETLQKEDGRIRCIFHETNQGQQSSLKEGMSLAKGRAVVTMDDDLQQDPEDILLLWEKLKEGYQVVYGLPQREGYPLHRALGSRMVDGFFTFFMDKPKEVKVGSFRILDRNTVDHIVKRNPNFVYITALTLEFTRSMANVPVVYKPRPYGVSNYSAKSLIKLFVQLFLHYGWKKKRGMNR